MAEYYELGAIIKGDKIFLQAGFIPKPRETKIGSHHSYETYGETNATAWISKPFRFKQVVPLK